MKVTASGIAILLLLMYVLWARQTGPNNEVCSRGYPTASDDTDTLFDRIEWSIMHPVRIDYTSRYLMWGLWVTFLGSILIIDELPSSGDFLRNWVVITIILLSLHGFYYWHVDKFPSFTMLEAVKRLRQRFASRAGNVDDLSTFEDKIEGFDAPFVFTHADYDLGTEFPPNYLNH